ncbi:MAG: phasin [Bauldia sp.]
MTTAAPKVAKAAKASVAAPFEAFNMDMSSVEVPAAFRDFAEKGIAQARDAYAKIKSAAEEATDVVENTYETAREGAFAIGVKALDVAKTNTDASFAFARDLFGAKTFAEAIELQTSFARKQFDTVAAQVKELQDLTTKFVTDTAKPVATQVEKTFKDIKAA